MRFARSIAALLISIPFVPMAALAQVHTQGHTTIEQPASASVIQDVISQANITVTVVGQPAAVSVGVPSSVNTVSTAGQNIQLTTTTSNLAYSGGVLVSQDAVSVSIGAIAGPQTVNAQPGTYDGVILVVAQYN